MRIRSAAGAILTACVLGGALGVLSDSLTGTQSASSQALAAEKGVALAVPKSAAAICAPPSRKSPPAAPTEPEYDTQKLRRGEARMPSDQCEVADNNLRRAADAVLAEARPTPFSGTHAVWDHRAPPAYLNLLEKRIGVSADERTLLYRNGFVVLDRAVWDRGSSFARLFHDIYQAELPLYVSVDAILHAIYASNDALIRDLEDQSLRPLLAQALSALYCALPSAAARYPKEVARDLDLYLTVAQSLLIGERILSQFGSDDEVSALLGRIQQSASLTTVNLFGRARVIDFSQFTPRGHYAKAAGEDRAPLPDLSAYFRAAMWLSRIEWNLVSRSCRSSQPGLQRDPSETPREAQDALALADLAQRSGALPAIEKLDRAWAILSGPREDVSVSDLLKLQAKLQAKLGAAEIATPQAATELRQAIGDRFTRTVRTHYMPPGSDSLPAIATLLGPRIVADAQASRPLTHSEVPERYLLQGLDLAYALGHDRAKTYLAQDLQQFPTLGNQLEVARAILQRDFSGEDLYASWLRGVRAIAQPLSGVTPSFMTTPAFSDLRVNSTLAGLGQLRHNYVLMAAQSYSEGGCEIPDAYLDPAVAVYEALLQYAARGQAAMTIVDPQDRIGGGAYFKQLARTLEVLRAIALSELANRPLPDAARRFLGMVAEMTPESTGSEPTYTGWYFDLFRRRQDEALIDASFITDIATAGDGSGIAYLGAYSASLGLFVVDTGGAPRLFIGPVATAFQARGPLAKRLSDSTLAEAKGEHPWAASYTAKAPRAPSLSISGNICDPGELDKASPAPGVFTITADGPVGPVTVELLDHHYARVTGATKTIGRGKTLFTLKLPLGGKGSPPVEGVALRAGSFSMRWLRAAMSCGFSESYGQQRDSESQ